MLRQCGQIIDGVQEFCDACWECSSQCSQCNEWFDKEQVGPRGLCVHCEQNELHDVVCQDCDHEWKIDGLPACCPHCGSFQIYAREPDDLFCKDLIEQKQAELLRRTSNSQREPPFRRVV